MQEYFNGGVAREFLDLFAGEELGSGAYRTVYAMPRNRNEVLKVETRARSFQNVTEWTLWDRVKDSPYRQWFCPCVAISHSGSILIQCRAVPFTSVEDPKLPKQIPAFFTDSKVENWGLYKGQPVCLDYGLTLITEVGLTKRTKKPEWWSGADG